MPSWTLLVINLIESNIVTPQRSIQASGNQSKGL